jgi:DNA ligase (NAD+)
MIDMSDEKMAEDARQQIIQWNAELIAARHAYYVLAEPIMSDKEYDLLELRLTKGVELFPEAKPLATVLSCVGSDLQDSAGRTKHSSPTLSLDNAYTVEEIEEWYEALELPADAIVTIEPKVDGVSCTLKFVGRKLVQAVTRGDGHYGEDITAAIAATDSIPNELPEEFFPDTVVEIRGEIYIKSTVLDKLNAEIEAKGGKPYANVRNLAAGTIKLKDTKEVKRRQLSFRPWQVFGLDVTGAAALEYLYNKGKLGYRGFVQPEIIRIHSKDQIRGAIALAAKLRDSLWSQGLSMITDGIVLKVDDPAIRAKLGAGTKAVKWAIAYKFQALQDATTLLSVEWQVGRTGKLTPVGIVEPVNLGGAIIQKASLCNWSLMSDLKLQPGCKVQICRSGDVIPQITVRLDPEVEHPTKFREPRSCPSCGGEITSYKDESSKIISHWCENPECPGQLSEYLAYLGGRTILDIDGLGNEIAKKFVEDEIVRDLGDLFLWHQSIAPYLNEPGFDEVVKEAGMPVAQIRTLIGGLSNALVRPWDRWLTALGIPGIGKTFGQTVGMTLKLQSEDLPNLPGKLLALKEDTIEGIGAKKLKAIAEWAKAPATLEVLAKLHTAGVRPTPLIVAASSEGGPLSGYVIVISGEFEEDRDAISKKLASLGAVMKSGVSKKVNLLLLGSAPGKSKIAKAKELGIRTETREWLVKVLAEGGMALESDGFSAEDANMDDL